MPPPRRRGHGGPRTLSRVTALGALSSSSGGGGGTGDPDLRAAAEVIADGARALASWSVKIPQDIRVDMAGEVATISAGTGAARPAELRLRHPLFGDRAHWYGPPGEPFLAPAVDARIDTAMRKFAHKLDRMARAAGFDSI